MRTGKFTGLVRRAGRVVGYENEVLTGRAAGDRRAARGHAPCTVRPVGPGTPPVIDADRSVGSTTAVLFPGPCVRPTAG
ncbi:hypothetical protein [Streptomyces kebangsaanensis]|uniref:hypothetical protein n=1 Tax=Streptomyces kebangsaanensis TaxID=864058 RepID=UPI0009400F1B|nr:hypothetical protein [Streptomyces kebangsaanensis]